MKLLLLTTAALFLLPTFAHAEELPTDSPTETTETNTEKSSSTLASSGVTQWISITGIYAYESVIKLNQVNLSNTSATGIYAEQVANISNAGIVGSNFSANNLTVTSGEISSSTIRQTAHLNGIDFQNSSVEFNSVVLN